MDENQLITQHERNASSMLEVAQAYTIDSPEMAEAAAQDLGQVKGVLKTLEEERVKLKAPALETCRRIDEMFKGLKDKYEKVERVYRAALTDWQARERARVEAERRAAEAAARAERERQEAEAEAARRAAAAEAEALRAAGQQEAATELDRQADIEQAETVAAVRELEAMAPAVAEPAKLAGVSSRSTWDFEIVDLALIPREYLLVDEKKIRGIVRALKSETNIPGIRAVESSTLAVRAVR